MRDEEQSIMAVRGRFLDFSRPAATAAEMKECARFLEDGLMLVKDGHIEWFGDWTGGQGQLPADVPVHDHRSGLIVPGFIDSHIHFPQAEIIGAYGEQLLEWLNNYAFPAEMQYQDPAYAGKMADFFINELLKNGTTTAAVFCTVHPESVDALFTAAADINMRIIAGKVMMDRHAPPELLDTPESSYRESRALIEKYHGRGRLHYAVTPRFAPTSTAEQLKVAGQLLQEYPDLYLQTHLSENEAEIKWVQELFPDQKNYLDVYKQFGLTGPRSLFAHCVHLEEAEWEELRGSASVIAFCPTSNLFLGSGLFDMGRARDMKVKVAMASDVGGGTSFSMLATLAEAYKILQLQGQSFSAYEALYSATRGGAEALSLDHLIGSFGVGKEADFVVLDPEATAIQAKRLEKSQGVDDMLFSLIILGDDRSISHTYVDGRLVHQRAAQQQEEL